MTLPLLQKRCCSTIELYRKQDSSSVPPVSLRNHTSSTGRVVFLDLSPGKYGVREGVIMYGFERGSKLGLVYVEPGENKIEMVINQKLQLNVSVNDANGPVQGAIVTVFEGLEGKIKTLLGESQFALTDSEGNIALPPLRGGRYRVVVQRAGGLTAEQVVDLSVQDQVCEFFLAGLHLSGHVGGADEACTVLLTELPPHGLRDTWRTYKSGLPQTLRETIFPVRHAIAECDANGLFRFKDLPAGDYSLQARMDGFSQKESVVVSLLDESRQDVNLSLVQTGKVMLSIVGLPRNRPTSIVARIQGIHEAQESQRRFISRDKEIIIEDAPLGSSVLRIFSYESGEEIILAEFPLFIVEGYPSKVNWDASTITKNR